MGETVELHLVRDDLDAARRSSLERERRTSGKGANEHEEVGSGGAPVFNAKGIGPNAFLLTAAAAIVPLFIVGTAGLSSLAGRHKQKVPVRLPRR